jgi:hypothetical protein
MQQHDSNDMIHEEEQRFNMSQREEVVARYKFASLPYYQKDHEIEEFEQKAPNFEPLIRYVVK